MHRRVQITGEMVLAAARRALDEFVVRKSRDGAIGKTLVATEFVGDVRDQVRHAYPRIGRADGIAAKLTVRQ